MIEPVEKGGVGTPLLHAHILVSASLSDVKKYSHLYTCMQLLPINVYRSEQWLKSVVFQKLCTYVGMYASGSVVLNKYANIADHTLAHTFDDVMM